MSERKITIDVETFAKIAVETHRTFVRNDRTTLPEYPSVIRLMSIMDRIAPGLGDYEVFEMDIEPGRWAVGNDGEVLFIGSEDDAFAYLLTTLTKALGGKP